MRLPKGSQLIGYWKWTIYKQNCIVLLFDSYRFLRALNFYIEKNLARKKMFPPIPNRFLRPCNIFKYSRYLYTFGKQNTRFFLTDDWSLI